MSVAYRDICTLIGDYVQILQWPSIKGEGMDEVEEVGGVTVEEVLWEGMRMDVRVEEVGENEE